MLREYPDRPFVGVGVVVWRDGKVLLVKRGQAPRRGHWSIPGGGQELGETLQEAACREVKEETGINIEVMGLIDVVDSIRQDEVETGRQREGGREGSGCAGTWCTMWTHGNRFDY